MFLIRIAFWLIVIIMLLPTDKSQQTQVLGTAEATVKDVSGFCSRNPDVCVKGHAAFQVFMQKAQFGANMVMGFVKQKTDSQQASAAMEPAQGQVVAPAQGSASPDQAGAISPAPAGFTAGSENTLAPADFAPAWRGPSGT